MEKISPADFFNKELAQVYDERNRKLAPIAQNMHFLIRLVLKDLAPRAKILSVGVGTGEEILSLAEGFPDATFVGVDPSAAMLEVCRERLHKAGMLDRCELIHGYVEDVPSGENFDAVLSVLVGHFIKRDERMSFFQHMMARLKTNGFFINTEISCDLNAAEFPLMLKNWQQIQMLMGATPQSLQNLPVQLREILTVLPPHEVEEILRQSGLLQPVRFFQAFMIVGWCGKKGDG